MKIISIINLKGGVGKTFTAASMAYILNQTYHASVLLVDNDKQGNLSKLYGAYQDEDQCPTSRLLLKEYASVYNLKQPVDRDKYPNMDIIPSNMSLLSAVYSLNRSGEEDQITRYAILRSMAAEDGKPYDYIIIDNPPDLGLNVINALAVTSDVIVPTKIDSWSLEGLDIISSQIREIRQINRDIRFKGVLVTMYQNDDVNKSGLEWLRESGYPMFDTPVRHSKKAPESTFFHQSVCQYSPRSGTARSYKNFVAEYLNKE